MAKAETNAGEMLRVRFVARPPARLVADEVIIEAGDEGSLPAALALELAANPHMQVVLVDEASPGETTPPEEPVALEQSSDPSDKKE